MSERLYYDGLAWQEQILHSRQRRKYQELKAEVRDKPLINSESKSILKGMLERLKDDGSNKS